jgi:ABC-type phosphonate transport system ATPase subunit
MKKYKIDRNFPIHTSHDMIELYPGGDFRIYGCNNCGETEILQVLSDKLSATCTNISNSLTIVLGNTDA